MAILERVHFEGADPLPRRALFFTTGQFQQSELAVHLGCEVNDKGTDRHWQVRNDASAWPLRRRRRLARGPVGHRGCGRGAEAAFAINTDLHQGRPQVAESARRDARLDSFSRIGPVLLASSVTNSGPI